MNEQLIIQSSPPWWVQVFEYLGPHWWGIAAILVAPIVGYAATQRFKAHAEKKPSNFQLAAVSGLVTFVLSFLMWWKGYRDAEGALIVAIMLGMGYPIIFTMLMGAAKKWWPWGYERLRGRHADEVKSDDHDNGDNDKTQPRDKEKTFFPRW